MRVKGSGGAKTGALVRSIEAMTVGAISAHAKARTQYDRASLGEIDQQFHVPVSGTATNVPQLVEVTVTFEAPFVDAYDERQSPYTDPTFTSGVYMPTGGQVFFAVCVRSWVTDEDRDFYTGAVIGVTAFVPTGTAKFDGEVHLNFEGYGAPAPDETEEDT